NHKLLELYKETPFFLLDIWGKDTWVKYVNLFPRDILVSDERFFSYFVEAGCLSSIDDAVEAVEINPDIMRYRDTTDILIDWLSSKSIEENVSFVERVLEFDISLTYLSKILHELVPIQKYEKIYSRLIGIASSGEIMPLPRNMRENPEGFRCPKHEIAYTFLSSVEKKKIIGPMFDRLQCSENLEDEHVNNIIAEYLHIAEPEDIKKLAKFLNEFPLYSDAVCFEEGKNLQTLKEFLVNPIAKTLIEILTLGYDEFLEGADVETAKASLDILITGDSDVHFWARNYSYHMFRQRQDLQDFVIEKLESESIGWDNIFGITDWIQIILSKGQAHHTEFVASLMEKMEMNPLVELYRTLIFQKDNEYYNKLCSVLAHLSKDRPITVTISAIAHLGKQLVSDINSLWDTKQYKDLSSKDRNDLKSGRWFDKHLDNSLKGEWRLVTW
ncbi:MAG: hypothetical protein KAU48_14245, partial [Candidatus Thorarchaeota archaeon]|nr:hypothetical protein [Candidatus Thorarchaeota archaeon]